MMTKWLRRAMLAGTALAGCASAPAMAQPADREAALERRLGELEAALADLRGQLSALRAGNAAPQASAAAAAPVAVATAGVAPPAAPPAPAPAAPRDGFSVAGTTVKIGGFVKAVAAFSRYDDGAMPAGSTGRDFYVPGTTPVGGRADRSFEANAKQTRLAISTATPLRDHELKGLVEVDFQVSPGTGNQRITNAYNPGLRRAFFTFDDALIGQEWSNFQYVSALPETTDFLGPSEGTVFVRQAQFRYAFRLARGLTLAIAAENPATTVLAAGGSSAMVEYDQDRVPDLTARLNLAAGPAELSLAGLARQLTADGAGGVDHAFAWGVSAAGKIGFGPARRHDIRFMLSHGQGIGRYVGLNLAPDAILGAAGLDTVGVTAGFAALRIGWTERLRSTVSGSFQSADYPHLAIAADANDSAWSAAANLFYSPVKQFDIGVEYRRGERRLVSGATGQLDRIEVAGKYSF